MPPLQRDTSGAISGPNIRRRDVAKRKPTDIVNLKLRFTEEMRAVLEEEAKNNHRSLNGEIVHRLATTLGPEGIRFAGDFEEAEKEASRVLREIVADMIARRRAELGEAPKPVADRIRKRV
jgi:hypothetical protein